MADFSKLIAQGDIPEGWNGPATGAEIRNPALGDTLNSLLDSGGGIAFFSNILPRMVGLIFVIGAVLFFFTLLIGAIQWITSGGDKTALESARGRISNALIGIVILFASFAIVKLIEGFFGVNILQLDIGALKIE